MANHKCLPKIPYPKWAEEENLPGGYKSSENWAEVMRWARLLLDGGCLGGGAAFTASYEFAIPTSWSLFESTRYYPFESSWSVNELCASHAYVASATDTEYGLYVNGIFQDSVVIPGGTFVGFKDVSISGVRGDYLVWTVLDGGDGNAEGLSTQANGNFSGAGLNIRLIQGG